MASLEGGSGAGPGGAAAAASAGGMVPLSASPSLASFAQQQPAQQASLPAQMQLPLNFSLQGHAVLPLGGGPGAGGGGQAPLDAFLPLPFPTQPHQHAPQHYLQHAQQAGGGSCATGGPQPLPQPQFALPLPTGGACGGSLAGLPLNWPIAGDSCGATVQVVQLPPCSSGILAMPADFLSQQPQQLGLGVLQQQQQQQQAALSAPQIMSNTDHNGSTEGTQAWGGGGARRGSGRGGGSGRGTALEAEDSAAAESRFKSAPGGGGRRGRGSSEPPRKSKYRWGRLRASPVRPRRAGWPRAGGTPPAHQHAPPSPRLPLPFPLRPPAGACSGTRMAASGGRASTPTGHGTLVRGAGGANQGEERSPPRKLWLGGLRGLHAGGASPPLAAHPLPGRPAARASPPPARLPPPLCTTKG